MGANKSPGGAATSESSRKDRRQGKNKNDCPAVVEWWCGACNALRRRALQDPHLGKAPNVAIGVILEKKYGLKTS